MIIWPKLADIVPEGSSGNVQVEHFVVSNADSQHSSLRAIFRPGEFVDPGKYARLRVNGGVMMSDTLMEQHTNRGVIIMAKGHVLIAGLGLGMIIHPIAAKKEVKSILIVEKSPDVIKLVGPTLPKKAKVVEADIFEWAPAKGTKYDTLYFDIWPTVCTDNLDDMAKLNRKFARSKAPGAWINSWQRSHLLELRRRERNEPWAREVRCGMVRSG